jgi:hypothetical protein
VVAFSRDIDLFLPSRLGLYKRLDYDHVLILTDQGSYRYPCHPDNNRRVLNKGLNHWFDDQRCHRYEALSRVERSRNQVETRILLYALLPTPSETAIRVYQQFIKSEPFLAHSDKLDMGSIFVVKRYAPIAVHLGETEENRLF